ncbi:MAG TPA: hypothetical protein VF210_04770 [Pseudomonadales bacterium]
MRWILVLLIGCGCGGEDRCAVQETIPYATEAQCQQAARQVRLIDKSGMFSTIYCTREQPRSGSS